MYRRHTAGATGTYIGDGFVPVRLEVGHPVPQRPRVMLAQRLDMAYFESALLQHRHDHPDLVQLAIGKHIAVHEAAVDLRRRYANRLRWRHDAPRLWCVRSAYRVADSRAG